MRKLKVRVLVVSDRVSAGEAEDRSGKLAVSALKNIADSVEMKVVPDEQARIRERLIAWCDEGMDAIFTVGGTGLSPRDVTPEATQSVIEREIPAIATALLVHGLKNTPRAALSRAVAGTRGKTLIINLPGSPSAVQESIWSIEEILPHAIEMMAGGGHPEREQGYS